MTGTWVLAGICAALCALSVALEAEPARRSNPYPASSRRKWSSYANHAFATKGEHYSLPLSELEPTSPLGDLLDWLDWRWGVIEDQKRHRYRRRIYGPFERGHLPPDIDEELIEKLRELDQEAGNYVGPWPDMSDAVDEAWRMIGDQAEHDEF